MNIGIIGWGKMGSAIFRLLASKPYHITVLAIDEAEARASEKKCLKWLKRSLRRGAMSEDEFQQKKASLIFTSKIEDLATADLVIEAIFEGYDEKVDLFRELESVVAKNTVLATNTSSLSIEQLAKQLKYKDRFCGLHFFYPVMVINLAEIIRSADTSENLVNFLLDFCKDIGKQAIVVYDSPGSMINLILVHYYVEALYILEEGQALPSQVDELAKKFFYIGPCESMDVIGIDFFVDALNGIMDWFFDAHVAPNKKISDIRQGYFLPYLFGRLISENRLGKKVSKGIYLYKKDKPCDDVPEFYINPAHARISENGAMNDELIANRLLYSIFTGCLYCQEKGLSTLKEVDLGIKEVLLMENGPFEMMQQIGGHKLRENFDFLAQDVGQRFKYNSFDFLEDLSEKSPELEN